MSIKTSLVVFITCFLFTSVAYSYPEARITIKAVDESGVPMEGIQAGATFEHGKKFITVKGFTDSNGLFIASSENLVDDVAFGLSKEGYYDSFGNYNFQKIEAGQWLPWNPEVNLVLRKIENPVAMYAREAHIKIPIVDKEVGFDLVESDWVVPYGKGKISDFTFKLDRRFIDENNFDANLALTFPNKFDGIQVVKEDRRYGSKLKLPRYAPANGYQKKLAWSRKRVPGKALERDYKEDNNYILRVRSEEKDGKLVRAMYGKIHGDLKFDPREADTAMVLFKYYLNPDYTKNLEFDPKQNLFKGLRSTEEVGLE